ncbi:MAG: HD domain-containing protein [Magnetococcales bacterium]|nr:HD domain-containing protein [Magnetococcales bacterium]
MSPAEAPLDPLGWVLRAVSFAAVKHQGQRRKSAGDVPYINHPVAVAETVRNVGGVEALEVILAALLHDTLEDTATTPEELQASFGPAVLALVREVSDDKSLPKGERKRLQIVHAPHKSWGARAVKLADMSCNIGDMIQSPPVGWSMERQREYLEWCAQVLDGLRGDHPRLERLLEQRLAEAGEKLAAAGA